MQEEKLATTLCLHFINPTIIERPKKINDDLYLKCKEAFVNNRGKFEWEEDAILEVLLNNKKQNEQVC